MDSFNTTLNFRGKKYEVEIRLHPLTIELTYPNYFVRCKLNTELDALQLIKTDDGRTYYYIPGSSLSEAETKDLEKQCTIAIIKKFDLVDTDNLIQQ